MATLPSVEISDRAAKEISVGFLWVYSNEIKQKIKDIEPGTWVDFHHRGKFVGLGYVNPHSLIAGRVVSLHKEVRESILRHSLEKSFEKRKSFKPVGSCRLVFSEADFLPGLIVDFYSGVLVVQINTAGMAQVQEFLGSVLVELSRSVLNEDIHGLVFKGDSSIRRLEGLEEKVDVKLGDRESLTHGVFTEYGVKFSADFVEGQKTGFFLDQRENRSHLREQVEKMGGPRVLDLCCYSGGWGLSALAGGASHVTFVDQSSEALKLVQRGLKLNSFPEKKAHLIELDIFDYLEKAGEMFDVVVADPPAFVKSRKTLPQGLKAYEKLNRLAARVLKPGGLLYTCSCSFHVSEADFLQAVKTGFSKAQTLGHIVYRGTQGADHPYLLSMPETNYLKCLGVKKLSW